MRHASVDTPLYSHVRVHMYNCTCLQRAHDEAVAAVAQPELPRRDYYTASCAATVDAHTPGFAAHLAPEHHVWCTRAVGASCRCRTYTTFYTCPDRRGQHDVRFPIDLRRTYRTKLREESYFTHPLVKARGTTHIALQQGTPVGETRQKQHADGRAEKGE